MKTGMTLTKLAEEIERRAENKIDFITPTEKLEMVATPPMGKQAGTIAPYMRINTPKGKQTFGINQLAHNQLAENLKIPAQYYNRMLATAPELLAQNVNTWLLNPLRELREEPSKRRMMRTLDGNMRAFLSDKFRPLENEDLAEAVLPVLLEKDLLILSCDITQTRLYIKAVSKNIERDVPHGNKRGDGSHVIYDTLSPAITISNSEVGFGALSIETGTYTKACTNLAMFGASMRKYHTGSRAELSDEVYQMLSDKTRRLTDASVWAQTRDLVRAAFDLERFNATVEKLTECSTQRINDDVVTVIERVAKRFAFSEGEKSGILTRLIEGADLTRYGLHSAITRHSADVDDYDRASMLERLGGEVIELPKSDWKALAEAA